jgi:hypothetical protein
MISTISVQQRRALRLAANRQADAAIRVTGRWLPTLMHIGVFFIAVIVAAWLGSMVTAPQPVSAQPIAPHDSDRGHKCNPTIPGQVCSAGHSAKSRAPKKTTVTHVECSDDVREQCDAAEMTGEMLTSADGITYPEGCHLIRQCKTLKGPATKFTIIVQ